MGLRRARLITVSCVAIAALSLVSPGAASATPGRSPERQALVANDGWASAEGGTTGGSRATAARTFTVHDRAGLVAALTDPDPAPRIVRVRGTIDGNVDDANRPLTCESYQRGGYTLPAYLAAYDPAVWGRAQEPAGPLEEARLASVAAQRERVQLRVPSNTTVIGVGRDARLRGISLQLNKVDNVIVRNLTFDNAADCFPQWDPTDTAVGNWNSEYDTVSVVGSRHVWVDHSTFTDGAAPDSTQPRYFDRPYQVHDGQLDLTTGTDLVTVSWNRFTGHDKVSLFGSTNNPANDRGKLRITVHHNEYADVLQRLPRVRFGQVDVYNNSTVVSARAAEEFVYALGVGVESRIYAENNSYLLGGGIKADRLIYNWGGTAIRSAGALVNGRPVDLLAAHNAVHDPDLSGDVGWTPQYRLRVDPTPLVPVLVRIGAGAGRI